MNQLLILIKENKHYKKYVFFGWSVISSCNETICEFTSSVL